MKTTRIKVNGEVWEVPRGFGREYVRIAAHEAVSPASGLDDLLGLVGYTSNAEVIGWPLRRRVEASVYAANVHLRASDNPIQKHPKPSWFPDAWAGPPRGGGGLYDGPSPTLITKTMVTGSTAREDG